MGQTLRLPALSLLTVGICLPRLRSWPSSPLVAQLSSPPCCSTSSGHAWLLLLFSASSARSSTPTPVGRHCLEPRCLPGVVLWWSPGRGQGAAPRRRGPLDGGAMPPQPCLAHWPGHQHNEHRDKGDRGNSPGELTVGPRRRPGRRHRRRSHAFLLPLCLCLSL
jgi:hypothetical protein